MKRSPTACLRKSPSVNTIHTTSQQPYTGRQRSHSAPSTQQQTQITTYLALNRGTARIIYLTGRHGSEVICGFDR